MEGNKEKKTKTILLQFEQLQSLLCEGIILSFPFSSLCFHWLHPVPLLPIIVDGIHAKPA